MKKRRVEQIAFSSVVHNFNRKTLAGFEGLRPEEIAELRSSYNYPPAKLVPFEGSARLNRVILEHSGLKLMPCVPNSLIDWQKKKRNKSSLDLDRFHQQLLLSSNDKDLLHGFWSVVFWGYFSGTDGIFRPGRAISRVKWLIDGKSVHTPQHQPPTPNSILINYLRDARCLALEGRFGLALEALMKIRFVGMSFGSKIVMFMHPERAAVYDQVIAGKILADTSFDRMLVVDPSLTGHVTSKCAAYDAWCHYCDNKASSLNSSNSQWVDWTGIQHPWRAVDVERAIFAAPG